MGQDTQTRQILIRVDTQGNKDLQALAKQLGSVNKSVESLTGIFSSAQSAIQGFFAAGIFGFGIKQIAEMIDSTSVLTQRIAVLSNGVVDSTSILADLATNADKSRSSIDSLAGIYAKLTEAVKPTAKNYKLLLDVATELQQTFLLSGEGSDQAAQSATKLAEGLQRGTVDARAFRSAIQSNIVLAELLAKSLGLTVDQLKKFSTDGRLTANEVLSALAKNVDKVDEKFQKISQTFGQTATKAINDLTVKFQELNRAFDLQGNFAKGLDFVESKIGLIAVALGVVAVTAIPSVITAVLALGDALAAFALANPITAALYAAGVAVVFLFKNFDSLKDTLKTASAALYDFGAAVLETFANIGSQISKFFNALTGNSGGAANAVTEELLKYANSLRGIADRISIPTVGSIIDDASKKSEGREGKLNSTAKVEQTLQNLLRKINADFTQSKISAGQYFDALDDFNITKLKRELRDGQINVEQFNDSLNKIKIADLNRSFSEGAIGFNQFQEAIRNSKVDELNNQLAFGAISLQKYNQELVKVSDKLGPTGLFATGASQYLDKVGTLSKGIVDGIEKTFGALEDTFVDFLKTGTLSFDSFANSVIDSLARVVTQALILKPILESITALVGGSAAVPSGVGGGGGVGQSLSPSKNGNAFPQGIRAFANGGVVHSPTMFSYGTSSKGIMGEAGPEAILPLSRGSDGSLGVSAVSTPVIVNINNQAGVQIQQTEQTGSNGQKILELTILQAVNAGLSSGKFDNSMRASYGVGRRGF